jgi:hypothetical protein
MSGIHPGSLARADPTRWNRLDEEPIPVSGQSVQQIVWNREHRSIGDL